MPTAYHPSNAEWVRPIESLTSDGVRELQRLKAENAKLRELVRWMYDRMDESCAVQHPYAPAPISYDRLIQAATRARELGIEVDG